MPIIHWNLSTHKKDEPLFAWDFLLNHWQTPELSRSTVLEAFRKESAQRAWRITGDYGTGKSSFALALAHMLTAQRRGVPQDLRQTVDVRKFGFSRPDLLPILVTGSRAPLSECLLLAIAKAIDNTCHRGKPPQIIEKIRRHVADQTNGDASEALRIELLSEAARYVHASGKGDGLLIVLDELGKFLEFTALHPGRQDIYFLQMLAEAASRSGEIPILVVGLLHQGFQAYAEQLTLTSQKEWEKVAGRFEEILFDQPLEHTTSLVANALNVPRDKLRCLAGKLRRQLLGPRL
jgi:hypothetical protein